jgi:hypothetical protein
VVPGDSYPGVKRPGREVDHSPLFSAETGMNGGVPPSSSSHSSRARDSLLSFLIVPLTSHKCACPLLPSRGTQSATVSSAQSGVQHCDYLRCQSTRISQLGGGGGKIGTSGVAYTIENRVCLCVKDILQWLDLTRIKDQGCRHYPNGAAVSCVAQFRLLRHHPAPWSRVLTEKLIVP